MAESMTPEEIEALKKKEAKESRKPFYPDDIENTFGLPIKEHKNHPELGSLEQYTGMSKFTAADEQPADYSEDAGGVDNGRV